MRGGDMLVGALPARAEGVRVPFTTRMTVVRLSDGGLWVHSPTRLTPSLRAEIEA